MRLEKIVWYDRHHVLLSFDKFSYALSRFPRSIKIPTLYQDCLCETSEAWKNFKQFKILSRSPRPSRFTHALLRSSRFDHTTPYDPPAFLKRGERGKRDPSVNLAIPTDGPTLVKQKGAHCPAMNLAMKSVAWPLPLPAYYIIACAQSRGLPPTGLGWRWVISQFTHLLSHVPKA